MVSEARFLHVKGAERARGNNDAAKALEHGLDSEGGVQTGELHDGLINPRDNGPVLLEHD